MNFQEHSHFFNVFNVFRNLTHRKSASDLIQDEDRKARSVLTHQFRSDLCHHLGSDLIRSYVPKGA